MRRFDALADRRPPGRVRIVALALLLFLAQVGCASEQTTPPELLPIQAASVSVNQTLRLPLSVQNPSGVPITYSYSGPDLPGLAEVAQISGTPSGGEFVWTPLASHVGTHEFTFTASSSAGDSSQSALVTVEPSASAAPIFLRPGAGGTYDLAREPCVGFDVEVRDDDSLEVTIRLRETPPEGAVLTRQGPKRARFEWCPTSEQTNQSERWTILLEAEDGDHAPTQHDYLIVLRVPPKDDCPGEAPEVTVNSPAEGERITSATGFTVLVNVTDDVGVREAPLLYYTTVAPEDESNPDITSFSQAEFAKADNQWRAEVPPLGLAPGEERTVYFVISVTDNDDPNGASCDHRTETPLRRFIAVAPTESVKAGLCEACTASINCETGVCAAEAGSAGRCLQACNVGDTCDSGTCGQNLTVEGANVNACGDVAAACDGGGTNGECTNDANEPNETTAAATAFGAGPVSGVICPDDSDYYRIDAADDGEIELTLTFDHASADLDLELLDAEGGRLDLSETETSQEQVASCIEAGQHAFAYVYPYYDNQQAPYTLQLERTVGSCCTNDADEPDDTRETARRIDTVSLEFEGIICPADADHWYFEISEPKTLLAWINFDGSAADLDLELFSPAGDWLTGSYTSTNEEVVERDLVETGRYVLRIEVYGEGSATYEGTVLLDPLSTCTTNEQCEIDAICWDGHCDVRDCGADDACPADHFCPTPGHYLARPLCAQNCELNTDCRSGEACKRFIEGRGCGRITSYGQNGESCFNFEDCGGQRVCIDWPGGYCARAACTDSGDCESDTFCANVDGLNLCVARCDGSWPECRLDEGYQCATLSEFGGGDQQGCTPD